MQLFYWKYHHENTNYQLGYDSEIDIGFVVINYPDFLWWTQ